MSKCIEIKGAQANNLQSIHVQIPHGAITVITGVSGSGKSSLAFTTLYAEGQRRFIESMSSYVRQFLGKLDKPQVEYIKGLSPTIAIEQKVSSGNPRSTVGTTTEIYDYLKLLFAREGITLSPVSGLPVAKDTPSSVIQQLHERQISFPFAILYPSSTEGAENLKKTFLSAEKEGFIRIYFNKKIQLINEVKDWDLENPYHVVDRFRTLPTSEEEIARLADSISTSFNRSNGSCSLLNLDTLEMWDFNHRFERDGMLFEEPSVAFLPLTVRMERAKPAKVLDRFWALIPIWFFRIQPYQFMRALYTPGAVKLWENTFNNFSNTLIRLTFLCIPLIAN